MIIIPRIFVYINFRSLNKFTIIPAFVVDAAWADERLRLVKSTVVGPGECLTCRQVRVNFRNLLVDQSPLRAAWGANP